MVSPTERRSRPGDFRSRATSIVLAVLSAEVVILAVTGVALYFVYRPSGVRPWEDLTNLPNWLRFAHTLTAQFTVPTAALAAVFLVLRPAARRRWAGPVLGVALTLTTVAMMLTGFLLPWDQLALWAVTVGTDIDGYGVLFGEQVRFVLIGGVEVSPSTITRWLLVHAALAGSVLGLLVAFAWGHHLAARSAPTA